MKRLIFSLLAISLTVLTGCPGPEPVEEYDSMQGIVINEISPSPGIGKEG